MALNIPLPGEMGEALRRGFETGTSAYSRFMQPQLEREKQKQAAEQFKQQMALRREAAARANANADIQRQMMQYKLNLLQHPELEYERFKQLFGGGQQGSLQHQQQPQEEAGEGMGMFTPQGLQERQQEIQKEGQQPPVGNKLIEELKNNPIKRAFFIQKFKFDPVEKMQQQKETPEQKRSADLQYKLALENEKAKLADEKKRQGVIEGAQKDVGTLTKSLDALKRVKAIVEKNPDLFGHNWQGHERFLNSTQNKNAGAMTALLKQFIIDTEKEASSRGSQLALKFAINQKPNFAQSQEVALGNVSESIRMIENALEDAKKLSSNSKYSHLSDEELEKLASGGG